MKKISVLTCCLIAGLSLVLTTNNVQAGTITGIMTEFTGNGWQEFQINDNAGTGDPGEDYVGVGGEATKVGPGYGGQIFDAEYLFYKRVGDTLSLGLQTGFDVSTGHVEVGGIHYYAGDLALSFNNGPGTEPSHFEYAVDFGLYTEDYKDGSAHGDPVGGGNNLPTVTSPGTDLAGLYSVTTWNNDVINTPSPGYQASDPFAMETGSFLGILTTNDSEMELLTNSGGTAEYSFARIVSFDLGLVGIDLDEQLSFFAHWTMSCGNDEINGYIAAPANAAAPVPTPEPATIALFGIGLAGLAGGAVRRRFKKQKQL